MLRRDFLALGLAAATATASPAPAVATAPPLAAAEIPLRRARRSDDVCESFMVNTKLFYTGRVYEHTDAVVDLLKDLGVRIVRERITTGTSTGTRQQQAAMLALSNAGIRWHGTVGELGDYPNADAVCSGVMRYLVSYYQPRVGDLSRLMHTFGGCNEVNGTVLNDEYDPKWTEHARIMQRALWSAAKSESATRAIPVAGPSTRTDTTAKQAASLGDLSEWCDWGNAHMYNKGTSPTRNLDEHLRVLRPCFPQVHNWVFTETGYNDSPQDNLGRTIPTAPIAVYVVRAICDYFTRNVVYGRFELLDEPDVIDYSTQQTINRTASRDSHFGLIAMTRNNLRSPSPDTWEKKPEFYAVRRFLRLMSDRGTGFAPDSLRLAVTGGGSDLQQALVQKRDDRHYLLLWRDVEVTTIYPDASPIKVRPVDVRVQLATNRPFAVYTPNQRTSPVATYSARSSITVPVAGELQVVEIG